MTGAVSLQGNDTDEEGSWLGMLLAVLPIAKEPANCTAWPDAKTLIAFATEFWKVRRDCLYAVGFWGLWLGRPA